MGTMIVLPVFRFMILSRRISFPLIVISCPRRTFFLEKQLAG